MNYLLLNRNKNKIGLPPNKRYRLTPLARHKSEDRSRYCHNSKDKYWVVFQQALFFNAFLARHDDDNDAHIKDKN